MAKQRRVAIVGTGSYLPERVLTNADLEKIVDTTDEWIRTRTGILERRLARGDEVTSDMAAAAASRALESAGIAPTEVDLILVATITPDMPFPSTACYVQDKIGATNAFCMDVSAACSGFIYAMESARAHILAGGVKTALVIGAEKLSSVMDWEDRATCVLFGDGAGAVVLRESTDGRGILSSFMGSDGSLSHLLNLPGGGSRYPASEQTLKDRLHCIKMTGNEVFKHAVRCMCDAGNRALDRCGLTEDDVRWIVPHQANLRIIQAIASRLGGSIERFIVNLDKVGNVSGASIPLALDEAVRDGRVKPGDKVLLVAFGGGFTWGAMLVEM
ncbi:MAG: ketoacyl-ACP synthase III [Lentisphaerae bacterium]|nr:ketoacyl-ACP synthase III [Lentisphaerota bacterium]